MHGLLKPSKGEMSHPLWLQCADHELCSVTLYESMRLTFLAMRESI